MTHHDPNAPDHEQDDEQGHDHGHESGHDHPQTIDSEPLDQTRSGKLLDEQAKAGAVPIDEEDDE